MILNFEGQAENISTDEVIHDVLKRVKPVREAAAV
jgi:hypothetical protein